MLPVRHRVLGALLWVSVGLSLTAFTGVPQALPTMAHGAEVIFEGRLLKKRPFELVYSFGPENRFEFDGVELVFRVRRWIQGGKPKKRRIRVHQLQVTASDIKVGEQVLWFLPPKDFLGAQLPFGKTSGDFRVRRGKGNVVALSLSFNELLWHSDRSLWDAYRHCREEVYLEELEALKLEAVETQRWTILPRQGYVRRPVPVDILIALTKSCLKKPES